MKKIFLAYGCASFRDDAGRHTNVFSDVFAALSEEEAIGIYTKHIRKECEGKGDLSVHVWARSIQSRIDSVVLEIAQSTANATVQP